MFEEQKVVLVSEVISLAMAEMMENDVGFWSGGCLQVELARSTGHRCWSTYRRYTLIRFGRSHLHRFLAEDVRQK